MHHELRQAHGLLYGHIVGTWHLAHPFGSLLGLAVEFVHVLAIELDGDVGLGTRHEFVEAQLNGLAEVELCALHLFKCLFHLFHHLFATGSRGPFGKRFHDDHDVGIFHRHGVGRHLGRADFRHYVFHLGEALAKHTLGLLGEFNALRERTTCGQRHLHGEVALVERRDELCTETCEEQQCGSQKPKGRENDGTRVALDKPKRSFIITREECKEAVGQGGLERDVALEEERAHHRHVGE